MTWNTEKIVHSYIWGDEEILWGFDSSHKYTYKILKPKPGELGCLSLQRHEEKDETWLGISGLGWGILVDLDRRLIRTRLIKPNMHINIPAGTIHRLMGIDTSFAVAESSTLDEHAADKEKVKDVIRLDCIYGRECAKPRNLLEEKAVKLCINFTKRAIKSIEKGSLPKEIERIF